MGSNTIIAIVVGAILVIVGFALWPVLNGASNSLYSYFQDSCDDGNGNRFLKAYIGIDNATLGGRELGSSEFNTDERVHGGSGTNIVDRSGQCAATGIQGGASTLGFATNTTGSLHTPREIYNEQGDGIGGLNRNNLNSEWRTTATGDTYSFIKVAPMLDRFAGINNLLLTVIPVVSIAGFLGISGAKLYSYGKGTSSIGSSISTSVFTLIGIVIAMVIAGPVLGQAVAANQVVVSGQYEVNGTFGNIISLLFAMIPVIYIAGLVTLVGLQARTALMGGKSDGSVG